VGECKPPCHNGCPGSVPAGQGTRGEILAASSITFEILVYCVNGILSKRP